MLKAITDDINKRIAAQPNSMAATDDEVSICWLVAECEQLAKEIGRLTELLDLFDIEHVILIDPRLYEYTTTSRLIEERAHLNKKIDVNDGRLTPGSSDELDMHLGMLELLEAVITNKPVSPPTVQAVKPEYMTQVDWDAEMALAKELADADTPLIITEITNIHIWPDGTWVFAEDACDLPEDQCDDYMIREIASDMETEAIDNFAMIEANKWPTPKGD